MGASPLGDRPEHGPVRLDHLRAAERELPADVGLELEGASPGLQRQPVERASGTSGEAGPVQEHTGPADHPGPLRATGCAGQDPTATGSSELPAGLVQLAGGTEDPSPVGFARQVGAVVAAAPLSGWVARRGEPSAPAAVPTGPGAREEVEVEEEAPAGRRVLQLDPAPHAGGAGQPSLALHGRSGSRRLGMALTPSRMTGRSRPTPPLCPGPAPDAERWSARRSRTRSR
jgi:hypothetical protein